MSEISGGNDNESNDDLSFNLDSEWEQWNKELLEESPEELAEQELLGEQFEEIKLEIARRVDEMEIPHVLDEEEEREGELFLDFAENWMREKENELEAKGIDIDSEEVDRMLTIECTYAYYDQRALESYLVTSIAMIRFIALNADNPHAAGVDVVLLKKKLQAELLVHYEMPFEHKWQQLVLEQIPTESLDMTDSMDRLIVIIAKAAYPEFKQMELQKRFIIEQALEIAGIDTDEDELGDVAQAVAELMNMRLIASNPIFDETSRANRNAALWQQGRKMQLDHQVVQKIVDLFDRSYPVIDSSEF